MRVRGEGKGRTGERKNREEERAGETEAEERDN